ncbi:gliding motility-associated C-terminal domain-containing protein [Mucilaginibacter flavus]|uniref:gliding motility-associated C-terminal domain-containing protein n=1 Tax=Mucilaginibacter flavus TaxID=931504 RepID=UPI0025B5D84A|nr:gliding motility-associated C-terminal domain-containing protein [Mucilaginibacter flavus]MDN3581564.1 gliding motility-associated C-terminal domain-containing protein [Mucilaginibacter flavus]
MWCRQFMLMLFVALSCLQASATVFVVSSNADSGPGTLRDALAQAAANGSATQDIINFNLPGSGAQALTIKLFTQLPEVTSNLVIDGSSQPGPKLGNSDAKVYIIPDVSYTFPGTKAAALLMTETSNVDIYGLCIKGYDSKLTNFNGNLLFTAISAYDCVNVTIGAPGKGNVFADNIYGIYGGTASLTDSKNNTNFIIESNFIGYDESGTNVVELGYAIDLTADDSFIGGPASLDRNYFAKNVTINGQGNSFVNNSLSLDIHRQDIREAGASVLIKFEGSGVQVTDNDFCATQFQFISVSNLTFSRNKQSDLPGNSLLYFFKCNFGFIGDDDERDMNFFNNDGGAMYAVESSNIVIKKNSISCNQKPYLISAGTAVPDINVLVNSKTEFSGTGTPGADIYIYNDNTDCSVCNPVQYYAATTADASGKWKITGDFNTKKLVANAIFNNNTSEYTQPQVSADDADHDIIQPSCDKNNGSITLKNLKNVITVNWFTSDDQPVGSGVKLDNVGPGIYYAKCYSGSCNAKSINFTLTNYTPSIDASGLTKTNAHCHVNNGSITGIKLPAVTNAAFTPVWKNADGTVVGNNIDLKDIGPGTYTLALGVNQCVIPYGPITIVDEARIIAPPTVNSFELCTPGAAVIPVANPVAGTTYRLFETESGVTPLDEQTSGVFHVTISNNTSYYVSAYNDGCESERTKVNITVGLSAVSIANAITPNGDGQNDYWQIKGIENYPSATVKIFNRNGQNVFDSRGYARPFDGTLNKQKLPSGTYYYIISLTTGCNMLSGSLTLIR